MGMAISRLRTWLVLLLLPLALAGCGVNTIPTRDEQVKAAWAEVQNQYQRRADLIPNLVRTVQGYAQQERTVLREVVEARARATSVNVGADVLNDPAAFQRFQQAQDQLSGALGRLLVVTENYPELRSNQNFLQLQSQLEGTENRITIARRDYNEAVRVFNTEVRTFPGALWAGTVHRWAKVYPTFQAQPGSEVAPRVDFGAPAAPTVNVGPGVAPGAAPAQ
jgi:LemA protein